MNTTQAVAQVADDTGSATREASGEDAIAPIRQATPDRDDLSTAPTRLDVQPIARDDEIRSRLQSVLDATGWFSEPIVRVDEGVVFLSGYAETEELRRWAGDLARNTQDVAAVANAIEVIEPSLWDFSAASTGLARLWRDLIRSIPFVVFGLFIMVLSAIAGLFVARGARRFLMPRVQARLLRGLLARAAGIFVFLIGTFIVLRIAGLTQLALTIVGGTGLFGLAVGIAFRDITENYLASIFLSMQRPFETGDLVEVAGVTGLVQQLNVRATVLMTFEGNLVQVPNAAVYKSNIRNFTANPNLRESFAVGIGYSDSIECAQEIARTVLADHPAILNDPEPWVLVDGLSAATVNLRIYFWVNGHEHSIFKVRSSVIRLVKRAFQNSGISMPDESREVVFPHGVPVTMLDAPQADARDAVQTSQPGSESRPPSDEPQQVSTPAEAGFASDADVLEAQARQAKPLDKHANLLQPESPDSPTA
ncbi:MAG: BON domain-containing protein [Phycisphaerales bacterium]|nr:MAG: BON domain-containing protein [Phycisphaerales bacterium]